MKMIGETEYTLCCSAVRFMMFAWAESYLSPTEVSRGTAPRSTSTLRGNVSVIRPLD